MTVILNFLPLENSYTEIVVVQCFGKYWETSHSEEEKVLELEKIGRETEIEREREKVMELVERRFVKRDWIWIEDGFIFSLSLSSTHSPSLSSNICPSDTSSGSNIIHTLMISTFTSELVLEQLFLSSPIRSISFLYTRKL